MEWWMALLIIFGSLTVLMFTGLPVAFCFVLINLVGVFLLWNGIPGLNQYILTMFASVSSFDLLPVPLFIIMGEAMLHSGLAPKMIDALDRWLWRIPGRLGLLAVGAGVLFATLTGASMASVAMLGSALVPDMEKRGYKKAMSLGPILGSGGLAMMIPPSAPAVVLGSLAQISIGKLLLAIVGPGLLMAIIYAIYIIGRCSLQPSLAPAYGTSHTSLSEKLVLSFKYIVPVGFIIFLVMGVVLLGVATPSEAAATGTLGMFILVAAHKRLTWEVITKSFSGALRVTVMVLFIMCGAATFSQILAFSGGGQGLVRFVLAQSMPPMVILVSMHLIAIFLGMFLGAISIMMITLPLFMPVVNSLGFNPVWFGATYMISLEMAQISPPYGLSLYTLKAVAPEGTTLADCIRAAMPFLCCTLLALTLAIAFPAISLWLPGRMR